MTDIRNPDWRIYKIIEKMLDGIEVKTDTDYFEFIKENPDIAEKTLFTGMIDEYFGYKLGALNIVP